MFKKRVEAPKHKPFIVRHFLLVFMPLTAATALWGPTVYTNLMTRQHIYETVDVPGEEVPVKEYAIVFGAGLKNMGKDPSPLLRWRIEKAVELHEAGKVERLLMTGDGSYPDHDEPAVMRAEAIRLGVPASKIDMDKFGFDTFDSCHRAFQGRGIRSAVLVTQGYHLPRAVYSCRAVGMEAVGIPAEMNVSAGRMWPYLTREWLATDKLFIQLLDRKFALLPK